MAITFRLDDSKAVARIRAFEGVLRDMTPAYRVIGSVLVRRINMCFRLGIDPFGNPWAKLKIRKGQPLRDTGRLQRSITSRADSTGVTVGTNVLYARTHQFGAEISPVNAKRLVFPGPNGQIIFAKHVSIPGRPFLPIRKGSAVAALPTAWAIEVIRSLRTYLTSVTQKAA